MRHERDRGEQEMNAALGGQGGLPLKVAHGGEVHAVLLPQPIGVSLLPEVAELGVVTTAGKHGQLVGLDDPAPRAEA